MLPMSGAASAHSLAGTSVLLHQVSISDTHLSSKEVVQKGVWVEVTTATIMKAKKESTASLRDLIIPLGLAEWERQRRRWLSRLWRKGAGG